MSTIDLYKIEDSDAALVYNGVLLQSVDADFIEDGTIEGLETLAKNLSTASGIPVTTPLH